MTDNDDARYTAAAGRWADPRIAALAAPYGASTMIGDGQVVLTIVGELDLASLPQLRSAIGHAADSTLAIGAPSLVVDLAGVRFLDAGAIAVLTDVAARLHGWGARIAVRGVSSHVAWLLNLTGAGQALGVEPPLEDSAMISALTIAASLPAARAVLDSALRLVVTMAHAVVAGADGASITLPRAGALGTVAASNDVVLAMDHDQYATGEGPCLDAATQGKRFHIGTLVHETRWPAFVPLARARGIETILSTPLVHDAQPLGALNIYSRTAEAFAANEQAWADQFASEAAAVVFAARHHGPADVLSQRVQSALVSRDTVTRAQGLVMARDGIGAEEATAVLRQASREAGQPLRETCEALLLSAARAAQSAARSEATAHDRPAE